MSSPKTVVLNLRDHVILKYSEESEGIDLGTLTSISFVDATRPPVRRLPITNEEFMLASMGTVFYEPGPDVTQVVKFVFQSRVKE